MQAIAISIAALASAGVLALQVAAPSATDPAPRTPAATPGP